MYNVDLDAEFEIHMQVFVNLAVHIHFLVHLSQYISDNIVNAIHQSRWTLCVLSSHFFDSYWCMYELNMARMESIYSRKGSHILCLVILNKTGVPKYSFESC